MSDVSTSNNQPQYTLDRNGLVNTLEGDPWGATIPQLRSRLLPIQPHDKVPFKVRDGGPRFKGRGPVSHAQVDRWNDRLGPCNWAIRTGSLGGALDHLTVLDVDRPELFPEDVWSAWAVLTSRGWHLYGAAAARSGVRPWGEIKADGGFVIAPGATHHTGALYEPMPGFGVGDQLPLFPAAVVLDNLTEAPPEPRPKGGRPEAVAPAQGRVDVPVGHRDNALFLAVLRAAQREPVLRGDGERLAALARWHGEVLTQPLPGRDLDRIGRQVAEYSAAWSEPTERFSATQSRRGVVSGKARQAALAPRNAAIRAGHEAGFSRADLAGLFGVSVWTVGRVVGTKT